MSKRPRVIAPATVSKNSRKKAEQAKRRGARAGHQLGIRPDGKGPSLTVEQQIEAGKQSTVHLLLKVARLTNEFALRRNVESSVTREQDQVESDGAANGVVGPAHLALFPHIPWQGIRLTKLAERVGTSKQAVGQLVDDLESAEIVVRVADPSDRRAKRIVFTAEGKVQILRGLDLLQRVQAHFEHAVGEGTVRALRPPLLKLLSLLESSEDDALPELDLDADVPQRNPSGRQQVK